MNTATDHCVMPNSTTGGTDVICEKETDKRGERVQGRWKKREWGEKRERERDREGERGREMQ